MENFTKYTLLALLIVLMSAFQAFSQKRKLVKVKTVEKLAKKFVKAIKNDDFNRLYELFPPQKGMINQYRSEMPATASRTKVVSNFKVLYSEEYYDFYKNDFIDVVKKGEKLGIDYLLLDYLGVDKTVCKDKPFWDSELAYISVKYFNNYFLLPLHAIKINGGWYLMPIIEGEAKITEWMKPGAERVLNLN